ncbi:hypothetical protein ACFT2C_06335 [Promicromonospora sp. NPDC057138]|uniref:hypothetical protein n=1 Tax=Promicromonospora sp. NPDC057138 TaxID=3346031 RepID=UPI00363BFC67
MEITTRRRRSLLERGESLLLPMSALDVALRNTDFIRATGLVPDCVLCTPHVAVALPRYHADGRLAARDPIAPAELWHPLFWLPAEVAGRYVLEQEDGTQAIEPDEVWAVRVALQMSVSGLYDVESGTWCDVLADRGLDVTDDAVLARIRRWQTGEHDDVLDGIELADAFQVPGEDPSWAIQSAVALMDDMAPAATALLADHLITALDASTDLSAQDVRTVLLLGDALLAPDSPLGHQYWSQQMQGLDRTDPDTNTVAQNVAGKVRDDLYRVRDALWPHLDALEAVGREPGPPSA